MRIAFDVDDTLIVPSVVTDTGVKPSGLDVPNYETIALFKWFQAQGCHMIVWSGSGKDWAERWNEKLGLQADEVRAKPMQGEEYIKPDIAFDDCDVTLGVVNVKVKRFNNEISRKEWNVKKTTPINKLYVR